MTHDQTGLFERIAKTLSSRNIQTLPEVRAVSRPAAVLVPVFLKNGEAMVLFSKRAAHVRYHGGHVAFPGGVVDGMDRNPQQTALREAWEEIGLDPQAVRVLGQLDDSMTYAPPFVIYPFVGAIPFPYPFTINTHEVEKVFAVPLASFLSDDRADDWCHGSIREERHYPEFHRQGEMIWGTTASIVANFVGILKTSPLPGVLS